jgi:hypothetical protein
MFTIDRIKKLMDHYNDGPWPLIKPNLFNLSDILDGLDEVAGLETKWLPGHDGCCACNIKGMYRCRRPVGARVALHEEHLEISKRLRIIGGGMNLPPRFYFWLGSEAA